MNYCKPAPDRLKSMLTMLTGEPVSATTQDKAVDGRKYHGVFINADAQVVALASCNMAAAASLGCSLTMIPPGGAEAMVEDAELTKNATDNLYEVMNVFSSLFMDDASAHLKLDRVEIGDAPAIEAGETETLTMGIELGRYGKVEVDFVAS